MSSIVAADAGLDPLTGCQSRAAAIEELDRLDARLEADGIPVMLLIVDVDGFSSFNCARGVKHGDAMLKAIAACLGRRRRGQDCLARLGDDEFALIVGLDPSLGAPASLAADYLADLRAFVDPALGRLLPCSIGAATVAPGEDAGSLLARATQALKVAKLTGNHLHLFAEPGADEPWLSAPEDLRRAILDDEIEPHFQPLIDLETRRNVGFEMFARWTHPQRGIVAPSVFIKVAEEHGLIASLTEGLLRRACRFAVTWPRRFTLAMNVSLSHLADPGLPAMVGRVLADSGFDPARLELELPEAALAPEHDLQARISDLARIGVKLTLDDFGSSFGSLRALRRLPISKLKIDQSFVSRATAYGDGLEVFKGIVSLGRTLGIPTVAEGVENEATLQIAELAGCTMAQGWHFARPIPAPRQARKVG